MTSRPAKRCATLSLLIPMLIAALGLVAPVSATRASDNVAARTSGETYSAAVVKWTNKQRTSHERRKFKTDTCLIKAAQKWAVHMAARSDAVGASKALEHQGLRPILRRCDLTKVGENIAYGYSSRGVVDAWMHSRGHRRNILDRQFRLIGVGAAKDANGAWFVSQVFGRR